MATVFGIICSWGLIAATINNQGELPLWVIYAAYIFAGLGISVSTYIRGAEMPWKFRVFIVFTWSFLLIPPMSFYRYLSGTKIAEYFR